MAIQKNFVVKNGIEVNNNLIFADGDKDTVGIGTTLTPHKLQVNGGIGATDLVISGVSTVNNLSINGIVSIGNSAGSAGQYLVSTGTGVTWGSVPTVRSSDIKTAGIGATTFNTTYTVGLLDVYINGVKLSASEYTAVDSATVVLDDACFGGETVEFISYSPFGVGIGGTSIQGITILDEGTPVGSSLQVTSINFVGGSVTATSSGVGVTVYLSDYISSSGISSYSDVAGIATYSSNSGISSYSDVSGIATISSYSDVSGIATISSGLTGTPNIEVGTITALNGFTSGIGVTDPVQIQVSGNILTFNVVGVGSTSFTLF